jgi:hypothetical protein
MVVWITEDETTNETLKEQLPKHRQKKFTLIDC